jgi:phosphoribosyl 1,2-cyclic phosphodiesterase
VGTDRDAVLIDAGISCRETERRLNRAGLNIGKVKAVFISHEHTDHTRGVEVLSRKHRIPVYITPATLRAGRLSIDPGLIRCFSDGEPVEVGGLTVRPFSKKHDGIDPHSFTITGETGITAGIFTDIGQACENLVANMKRCHAAFLESNYDERMLMEGSYPLYLKRRIHGDKGHLSNRQALEVFTEHRAPFLSLLVLSHLSAHNNHPEIVRKLFTHHANGTRVEIASRYEETGVFLIQ